MRNRQYTTSPTTLDMLCPGELGLICDIDSMSPMHGRMEDIGLRPGVYIRCERKSLFGDPVAYRILRCVVPGGMATEDPSSRPDDHVDPSACTFYEESLIALRREDAACVQIQSLGRSQQDEEAPLIAMVGNPNVGKSSLFNALTGLHQHTGNWTGKTVGSALGQCRYGGRGKKRLRQTPITLADLPGSYSLNPHSPEEDETLQFLLTQPVQAALVVCEPASLGRNLLIAYQIATLPRPIPVILCVNLIDEAERHGITVDPQALSAITGFPVVLTVAKKAVGLDELVGVMEQTLRLSHSSTATACPQDNLGSTDTIQPASAFQEKAAAAVSASIKVCPLNKATAHRQQAEKRLDHLLTGRATAIPLAILLLALVFWLTIEGANLPSAWLSRLFAAGGRVMASWPMWGYLPWWIKGILLDGVYHTLTWVVAVMLPPMAIFFPLFTLLEDFGLLPRIAFNFDRCFRSCNACGKQALTMCMGFGCNAVGVTGCRIIDTPRERMLAVLTNSLIPCNGKFPTLVAMLAVLSLQIQGQAGKYDGWISAGLLTATVVICILITWVVSKILSVTILRGHATGFVMEMPPFRTPRVGQVLVRALLDRTLHVLGRAVTVAAPAGAILWLLTHIHVGGQGILQYVTTALDPIGVWLCVDGAILVALLCSAPANELTLPILLMIYSAGDRLTEYASIGDLGYRLTVVGWTPLTILAFATLFLFHAPCTTTLLTVKKETGRWRWVMAAAVIPAMVGIILCLLYRLISMIL